MFIAPRAPRRLNGLALGFAQRVTASSGRVTSARGGRGGGPQGDSGGGTTRGGTTSEGGDASSPASDRCAVCTAAPDCSNHFCNRVRSGDFLEPIGRPLPDSGECSTPGDTSACGCFVGLVEGNSLCVGTGCPGTPVTLCDHLSGSEFVAAVGAGGGNGGSSASGGASGLGASSSGGPCTADSECAPVSFASRAIRLQVARVRRTGSAARLAQRTRTVAR
jgi:hypothetical protein